MRKRVLSILLTLCMVLCLVPTAVLAVDEVSAKVNGIAVFSVCLRVENANKKMRGIFHIKLYRTARLARVFHGTKNPGGLPG